MSGGFCAYSALTADTHKDAVRAILTSQFIFYNLPLFTSVMLRLKPPAKHPFDFLIAKIEFRFENYKMEFFYFSSKKVPCSASIHPPPCKIMHKNLHAPYFSAGTSAPTNIKPTFAIFWRKWAINDLKCFRPAKKHLKIYGINYQISILTVFFPKFQENVASPERVLWLRYRPAYRPEKSVSSTGR